MKRTNDKPSRIHCTKWLLIVAGCCTAGCGSQTITNITATTADEFGRWTVGRVSFKITDASRERTLGVDAWYPVHPDDATGELAVYTIAGVYPEFRSTFALEGPPVSPAGPFPMIVFSHGNGSTRIQNFYLCEVLASHGFVVVAADHPGNTVMDSVAGTSAPLEDVLLDRPQDISYLITHMLQRNELPEDPFERSIDADRIGMIGHSRGGYTTMATVCGVEGIPGDAHIKAIMPIDAALDVLTPERLSAIEIPTFLLAGSADMLVPVEEHSTVAFAHISAAPRYLAVIEDAWHEATTLFCPLHLAMQEAGYSPWIVELVLGSREDACPADLIPYAEAHRLTNLYAVAFFKCFIADDMSYAEYLTVEYAQDYEPDVTFEMVGDLAEYASPNIEDLEG